MTSGTRHPVTGLVGGILSVAALAGACSSSSSPDKPSTAADAGRDSARPSKTDAGKAEASTSDQSSGDAFVPGVTPGYSAKFRATLANPAPAAQQEGERLFFEDNFGTEGWRTSGHRPTSW